MKLILLTIIFWATVSLGDSVAQTNSEDIFPVSITLSGISKETQGKLLEVFRPDETWYSKYQTALTGLAAIAAAIVALIGVQQQVKALFKIEAAKEERLIAAISAAFWSEMHHIHPNIQSQINHIRGFLQNEHVRLDAIELLPIETPIYDSLKGEIGKLPSDITFAAVGTYSLIRHYSMRMEKNIPDTRIYEITIESQTNSSSALPQKIQCVRKPYLESLTLQLNAILQNLALTSERLASIAKVDPNLVAALAENARRRQFEFEALIPSIKG